MSSHSVLRERPKYSEGLLDLTTRIEGPTADLLSAITGEGFERHPDDPDSGLQFSLVLSKVEYALALLSEGKGDDISQLWWQNRRTRSLDALQTDFEEEEAQTFREGPGLIQEEKEVLLLDERLTELEEAASNLSGLELQGQPSTRRKIWSALRPKRRIDLSEAGVDETRGRIKALIKAVEVARGLRDPDTLESVAAIQQDEEWEDRDRGRSRSTASGRSRRSRRRSKSYKSSLADRRELEESLESHDLLQSSAQHTTNPTTQYTNPPLHVQNPHQYTQHPQYQHWPPPTSFSPSHQTSQPTYVQPTMTHPYQHPHYGTTHQQYPPPGSVWNPYTGQWTNTPPRSSRGSTLDNAWYEVKTATQTAGKAAGGTALLAGMGYAALKVGKWYFSSSGRISSA